MGVLISIMQHKEKTHKPNVPLIAMRVITKRDIVQVVLQAGLKQVIIAIPHVIIKTGHQRVIRQQVAVHATVIAMHAIIQQVIVQVVSQGEY